MAKAKKTKAVKPFGAEHLDELALLLKAQDVAKDAAERGAQERITQRAVAIDGDTAIKVADAALEDDIAKRCEVLGDQMAAQEAVNEGYLEEGRALGIFPAAQGDDESGADYDKRCEAFEAPAARLGAWKRGFVMRAALRSTKPFSVYVDNESTGLVREVREGDNPAKVRTLTPAECYSMDADSFKALPGKASDAATLKGRVAASREAMQNIGNVRASRAKSDARDSGRKVEAATGAKGRGGRANNKSLASVTAVYGKRGATMAGVLGTDKGASFKAAFAAFADSLVERGILTRAEWDAARKG